MLLRNHDLVGLHVIYLSRPFHPRAPSIRASAFLRVRNPTPRCSSLSRDHFRLRLAPWSKEQKGRGPSIMALCRPENWRKRNNKQQNQRMLSRQCNRELPARSNSIIDESEEGGVENSHCVPVPSKKNTVVPECPYAPASPHESERRTITE